MAKLLIVDDEETYRQQLEIALSPDGHEIRTAAKGREAIDVATRFRPEVVVTDWMLADHIHGVHVAQVLQAVLPGVQVILITGFPSDDLEADVEKAGLIDFIEKPFDLDRIRSAVRKAAATTAEESPVILPMLEVDADGSIRFANSAAREILAETQAGAEAATLADVFSPEEMPDLDAATQCWVAASPRSEVPTFWHLRSQPPGKAGSRLIVLRRQDEPLHLGHTFVEMLLGVKERKYVHWPFDGRVLLLDHEPLLRRMFISMMESAGAGCYAAQTPAEMMRLLEKDQGIQFVVIDYDVPAGSPETVVRQLKAARPDVVVAGTSTAYHRDEFTAIGVDRFLQKPWRAEDLINLLAGKFGNCDDCGLALPLRHAGPGDAARSWVCAFCGSRYRGVMAEDCPPDIVKNVRLAKEG